MTFWVLFFREWQGLTENENNYLVQLMPPGDIIVQSIRDIVQTQNITNAAIVYDDSFGRLVTLTF